MNKLIYIVPTIFTFVFSLNAYALRVNRPPTLSYPIKQDEAANLNKFLEDSYNIQNGRFELDAPETTKTNAKNGEFWILDTGVTANMQFRSGGTIYTICNSGGVGCAGGSGGGGSGTPGGSDTQVQYNDAGAFGGDSGLTFNETTDDVTFGGSLYIPATTSSDGIIYQDSSAILHTFSLQPTFKNVFVGKDIGNFTNDGSWNYALGEDIFNNIFDATENIAIGYRALEDLTDGDSNISIGANTLKNVTTGSQNIAMGGGALDIVTTADNNLAVGNGTLGTLTTGSSNVGVGDRALETVKTSTNNTSIGHLSLLSATGYDNVALGNSAGRNITTGSQNTFIGRNAGWTSTTATISGSTCIGYSCRVTQSSSVILGDTTDSSLKVGIGTTAPREQLELTKNIWMDNTTNTGLTTGVIYKQGVPFIHNYGNYPSEAYNTFVGLYAGNLTLTLGNATSNTYIGYNSGKSTTNGSSNVFVGDFTGWLNTDGALNTFIGSGAGGQNTTGTNNAYLGYSAGSTNQAGYENTFLGMNAGVKNKGSKNTGVGYDAGQEATTSEENTYIGWHSSYVNTLTGNNNSFLGAGSGQRFTSGSKNTCIGSNSCWTGTTATITNSGCFGYACQVTNSNSIVLGGLTGYTVKVGIGINAPAAELHVVGESRITGISGDGTGKAVCIKSDGNLGTCTDAPNASGVCTCN